MKQIEKIGRTVDEAVEYALRELDVEKDKVDIEVLDEGSKGIFGLFGGKEARVRVTLKSDVSQRVIKFLKDVTSKMDMEVEIDYTETSETLNIELSGPKMGVLIGKHGETLDALQYLASIVGNHGDEEFVRVVIDCENYRAKRKETLVNLANRLAAKVARDRKNITLEPMNPYERRIIHSALQNNKYVETSSIGEEPNRRVIISYKK